jgi:hypothetical protein
MNLILKGIIATGLGLCVAQTACNSTCVDCCDPPQPDNPFVETREVGTNKDGLPEVQIGSLASTCQLDPGGNTALVWTGTSVDIVDDANALESQVTPTFPIQFGSFDLSVDKIEVGGLTAFSFTSGSTTVVIRCRASNSGVDCIQLH